MIDRKTFYDYIREHLFNGHLTQLQVDGIAAILNEWEKRDLEDERWLAYMLATVYHETGLVKDHVFTRTMQPVTEYGSEQYLKSKPYYPYIGRGFVQLTWDYNYKRFGEVLKINLVDYPDYALQPVIAVQIMFEGMIRGLFTGKKLSDYFNADKEDWVMARKIINGVRKGFILPDRANDIAAYAHTFYNAFEQQVSIIE